MGGGQPPNENAAAARCPAAAKTPGAGGGSSGRGRRRGRRPTRTDGLAAAGRPPHHSRWREEWQHEHVTTQVSCRKSQQERSCILTVLCSAEHSLLCCDYFQRNIAILQQSGWRLRASLKPPSCTPLPARAVLAPSAQHDPLIAAGQRPAAASPNSPRSYSQHRLWPLRRPSWSPWATVCSRQSCVALTSNCQARGGGCGPSRAPGTSPCCQGPSLGAWEHAKAWGARD